MSSARLDRSLAPSRGGGINPPIRTAGPITPPEVDEALINYLKQVFRPRLEAHHDLREYDRQLGAQVVIEHLEGLWEAQNNKD